MSIKILVDDWLFGIDWQAETVAALHSHALELIQLEVFNVAQRVQQDAFDTGALMADVQGSLNDNPSSPYLGRVFSGTTNQIDQWDRVYAQYQEGGDLGKATYTNAPHMMYGRVRTDDIADIQAWGVAAIAQAYEDIVNSMVVPF